MTTFLSTPQFGGDIASYFCLQDSTQPSFDPTTTPAFTFGAAGASPLSTFVPMDIVDIPELSNEAEMDSVMALGSYTRVQRNVSAFKPSLRFNQKVRGASLIQSGIRLADGTLPYYSFLTGNGNFARQMTGAMCESMDIDIPFESGAVTVALGYQALYGNTLAPADVTAAAIPPMSYTDLTLPVYYGYNGQVLLGGDDYTDYVKRVRISVKHEIERLPTRRKSVSVAGSPTIVLVSRHLKAKTQMTSVSIELYQAIPIANVAVLCRTNPTLTVNLTDDCHAGRGLGIGLTDVSFATDKLGGGDVTSLLNFSAGSGRPHVHHRSDRPDPACRTVSSKRAWEHDCSQAIPCNLLLTFY